MRGRQGMRQIHEQRMQQRRAVLSVKKASTPSSLKLTDVISQLAADPALTDAQTCLERDKVVSIEGMWPGAVAPVLAAWLNRSRKPLLVLCAHVAEAESLAAELGELCAARIEVLPPGSEDNEFESLQHQETAQRLHVLSWLYQLTHGDRPYDASAGDQDNEPSDPIGKRQLSSRHYRRYCRVCRVPSRSKATNAFSPRADRSI